MQGQRTQKNWSHEQEVSVLSTTCFTTQTYFTNEFKLSGFHHELLDWFNQMFNLQQLELDMEQTE